MRIATFNIENLDEPGPKDPSFEDRAAILRPQLARIDADILCLQEVHGQDVPGEARQLVVLRRLLEGTKYDGWEMRSTTLKGRRDVERFRNLVTIIRPDMSFEEAKEVAQADMPGGPNGEPLILGPEYRFMTADPPQDVRAITWERPMFYCRIGLPGGAGPIHVINVHYKSKRPTSVKGQGPENFQWKTAAGWAEGFFVSSMKRVGAALETRRFVDHLIDTDPEARVVVCGDLNAETHEVPVMALRGEVADTGNPDLAPYTLYPLEESVPEDKRFTLYHHGKKNMLDHLLASRSLLGAYRGTEIHNEIVRDESISFGFDTKFPASDHAPVIAEFALGD
ncbi:MAG: endonuclease/exonuclease/phosphatase family protein [Pseudomonadota bacterium]